MALDLTWQSLAAVAPDNGRLGSSGARLTVNKEHNGGSHSPRGRRLGSLGTRLTRRVVVVGCHRRILRFHHTVSNLLERSRPDPWLV